jgi:autotransporter-associated beta strand protein
MTFGGAIDNTNTAGLTKAGAGTLLLSATNTYNGTTTISGGVLQAIDGVSLPSGSFLSLDGGVFLSSGAFNRSLGTSGASKFRWTANGGAFAASGGNLTINIGGNATPTELAWGTTVGSNIIGTLRFGSPTANAQTEFRNRIDLKGATRTIDVAAGAGGDSALLSGVIRTSTGPAGITKTGAGTLVLSAANTYTGATTISQGTLKLASGATLASTAYDVAAGSTFDVRDLAGGFTLGAGKTLKGGGSMLGTLVTSGVVAPGASPGILTVEDITFSGTGALQIELGGLARGTEYDVLDASGTITLQNGSTLAVTLINGFVPQGGDTFDILDFAGLSGEFSTRSLPALGDGLSWDTSGLYTSGTIVVAPEPASAAMLIAGLACTLLRRRAK